MDNASEHGQVPEWTIADRLRKARELTGLDQTEFADTIGISRKTVSNYERDSDRRHIRAFMIAWALGAGVDYDWLVGQESPPLNSGTMHHTRGYDMRARQGRVLPLQAGHLRCNLRACLNQRSTPATALTVPGLDRPNEESI